MGLFCTTKVINKTPNVNINFDSLKVPLSDISNAITESNDKLIESQKERFVVVGDTNIRISLIESITIIKDCKFTITLRNEARTEKIEVEGNTSLEAREAYNKVAKILEVELSLPVCRCGVATESMEEMYVQRFNSYNLHSSFKDTCPECREKILTEMGLYRDEYDINTDTNTIILLDDQERVMSREDAINHKYANGRLNSY